MSSFTAINAKGHSRCENKQPTSEMAGSQVSESTGCPRVEDSQGPRPKRHRRTENGQASQHEIPTSFQPVPNQHLEDLPHKAPKRSKLYAGQERTTNFQNVQIPTPPLTFPATSSTHQHDLPSGSTVYDATSPFFLPRLQSPCGNDLINSSDGVSSAHEGNEVHGVQEDWNQQTDAQRHEQTDDRFFPEFVNDLDNLDYTDLNGFKHESEVTEPCQHVNGQEDLSSLGLSSPGLDTESTGPNMIQVPATALRNFLHNDQEARGSSPSSVKEESDSTIYDDQETLSALKTLSRLECDADVKDDYSLGASDEEDMAKLADAFAESAPPHIPPSSVIKDMDSDSAAEVFDPNLQRSSPASASGQEKTRPWTETNPGSEDLLESDFEWDEIISSVPDLTQNTSKDTSSETKSDIKPQSIKQETLALDVATVRHTPPKPPPRPKPFIRSPFPRLVRNKSPVTGISNNSMLRTCFRVGEMVNEGARCLRNGQDVVFELYARVRYSSREIMSRVQHFQFVDLFKDQRPYPTGTLTGWRSGSLLDQQSSAFLSARHVGSSKREKLCRCICKLKQEKKSEMGSVLVIWSIREVDWDEIFLAREIICRGE